jgi:anti-sigma B factor antagonist
MTRTGRKPARGAVKDVRWVRRTAVVEVSGDIDLSSSPEFLGAMLRVLGEKPRRIIVNLAEVPYMDSSGVATLVKVLRKVRAAGQTLALAGLNDRVRSIFEITKLDGFFEIHPTEKEAMG